MLYKNFTGDLQSNVKSLPHLPGVYQFLDENNTIIYVGKAKDLKKRVHSYFSKKPESGKTHLLVSKIRDLKFVVVGSEYDALILENELIKEHQPRYNIQLRDDKTYPWICIKKERFPRVFSTRTVINDGSKYFGPYASVAMMKTILDLCLKLFPIRNCNYLLSADNIASGKFRPCLEFQIGNCKAPCVDYQKEEDYNASILRIKDLLKGNITDVVKQLKTEMLTCAADLEFEKAEEIRIKLELLQRYQSKSTVVSPRLSNLDVCTVLEEDDNEKLWFNYIKVVKGVIIQSHSIEVNNRLGEPLQDVYPTVIQSLRSKLNTKSKSLLLNKSIEIELPECKIIVPKKGEKKTLVDLSLKNAFQFKMYRKKQESIKSPEIKTNRILEKLKVDLRLTKLPVHMECFDNSNIQGSDAVAACVVFKNAKPCKKDYRHFNIKTVTGANDFASMKEVINRRYARLITENKELPQLIVVDGGKGQLSSAVEALENLKIRGKVAVIGIAKKLEEIYFPEDSIPLYLDKKSESLRVIQQMRDEAHRFGITHHRKKRNKRTLNSQLSEIKGIGEATFKTLMLKYKSLKRIKEVPENVLAEFIGKNKARIINEHFKKANENV